MTRTSSGPLLRLAGVDTRRHLELEHCFTAISAVQKSLERLSREVSVDLEDGDNQPLGILIRATFHLNHLRETVGQLDGYWHPVASRKASL